MTQEDELRRRLELLKKYLDEDKIKLAPHLAEQFKQSLSSVRYGSDGKIDLDTVDGRVRSLALAVHVGNQREETKNIASLADIQRSYFEYIAQQFDWLWDLMISRDENPNSYSWVLSQDAEFVKETDPQIDKFLEYIFEFWDGVHDIVETHVEDMHCLKGVFGGDLFPSADRNVATNAGLYLDTIVLQCPFLQSRALFSAWSPQERCRYLVKHSLNLLNYKELALSEVDPPIVVVLPFKWSTDINEGKFLTDISEPHALSHLGYIFSRSFESFEDANEFLQHFETAESLLNEAKNPDRILFDTDWNEPLVEQFDRAMKGPASILGEVTAGTLISSQAMGRMMQANSVSITSQWLGGTPLIDAETSWRYFQWMMEYSSKMRDDDNRHLHVARALQSLAGLEMQWLGAIPHDALIEMRKVGATDEIRAMLSNGVAEVAEANEGSFFRTTDRVWDNIQDAFRKHQEVVREVKSKQLKFFGYDIGTWVVSGAIEITAAVSGMPLFGGAAFALGQVTDPPKLKDIPSEARAHLKAGKDVKSNPMGLFFKHKS